MLVRTKYRESIPFRFPGVILFFFFSYGIFNTSIVWFEIGRSVTRVIGTTNYGRVFQNIFFFEKVLLYFYTDF